VVSPDGTLHGVISARAVEQAAAQDIPGITAGDLARTTKTLTANQTLEQAMAELVRHDSGGLPVLDPIAGRVIGWLSHRDVLAVYARPEP
jgi:CBS domain-containing protein